MSALIIGSIDWVADWIDEKQTGKVAVGSREGAGRGQEVHRHGRQQ